MNIIVRILVTMGLLALLAFCGFGFLASFEPLAASQQWLWRLVYVVAAGSSCCALICLWRSMRPGS